MIQLMVSELASNCVRHTDSGFELTIIGSAEEIRVEAKDRGEGRPRVRSAGPTELSGRGLQIVDMFASGWGVDIIPGGGKSVWFRLSLAADPETATASA